MTDTGKKRVSSLAKEYEVTSDVFLRLLNEAGVEAKTSSSTIDQSAFAKVKPLLLAEKDRKEREELVWLIHVSVAGRRQCYLSMDAGF